tara:strand:+ start:247 stop:2151 length:1905 start_codon:yes stop_codon:yes gene_type:complete
MKEVKIKMVVDTKSAVKNIDNVDESIKDTSTSTQGLTGSLDTMSGGALGAFSKFAGGLKKVALGFRTVGGAIAASGIGLLVITIAAVTAAFKGSEEGQNKFAKIMGVIGAVTGNLIDLLADFGDVVIGVFENPKKAITDFASLVKDNITNRFEGMLELIPELGKAITLLFSGKFGEAAETAGNAMGKVALGVDNVSGKLRAAGQSVADFAEQNRLEGIAAAKVADQRAKADKIERGLLVDRAKAEKEIAELRLLAKDLNNTTAAERETALKKVMALEDSLIGREQEVANLRRDAQIAENGFARSTKENLDEEERLKAAAIEVETRRLNKKRGVQRELTQAENQINSEKKAASDKKIADDKITDDAEKKRLKSISDFKKELTKKDEDNDAKTDEEKLELERTRAETKLQTLIGTEEEKREALLILNEYYDAKEIELTEKTNKAKAESDKILNDKKISDAAKLKKENEKKEADELTDAQSVQDAKIQIASLGIGVLGMLAKEGSDLAKGVAVAQTSINTYQGIVSALAATTTVPEPFGQALKVANAVSVGVMGLMNVKKIMATKPVETSAPNVGDVGGRGGQAQAPSFNLVEGTEGNQIQNSIQNAGDTPLRAFVVSQDVTSQQSLDRQIEANSGI